MELVNCPTLYYHPQRSNIPFIRILVFNIIKNSVKTSGARAVGDPRGGLGGGV